MKTDAEVLEAAADLLESEQLGWRQGVYMYRGSVPGKLSVCAVGAIRVVITDYQWSSVEPLTLDTSQLRQSVRISDLVAKKVGVVDAEGWLPSWNDQKGRTKQEVIDAFKETAKDLRNANEPVL